MKGMITVFSVVPQSDKLVKKFTDKMFAKKKKKYIKGEE